MSANAVLEYHQRSKHQINGYARGPATLDWDDQPDPFRRFDGCTRFQLSPPGADTIAHFADLDQPGTIAPYALNLNSLGLLLELSFGLSAWKQYGSDRWALRCNPSSGNLHPTEAYLLCTDAAVLPSGVYHYLSHDHVLEQRAQFTQPDSEAGLYIGLSSVHWREAWKYGERAFRYCQHDVGHALAALSYAAASLGWSVELLSEISDQQLSTLLGLDRDADFIEHEREVPDLLCRLITRADARSSGQLPPFASQWFGRAKPLSRYHHQHWPVIEHVAAQCLKPATAVERWQANGLPLLSPRHNPPASQLIRQRRSAQHFNANADAMPLGDFQRIIRSLFPNAKPPFTAWNWPPQVHLVLFVHRVESLTPGLYCLPREPQALAELQTQFSQEFLWQKVESVGDLYLLVAGRVGQSAKTLSCHQDIAADSAFSLAMLTRFADNVETESWRYRRLFWECGLLGQILYLEAEAAGARGTGIGCFFDDLMHGVLALTDNHWQSLYHFTVGTPLNDHRLQTLPPYQHLQNA